MSDLGVPLFDHESASLCGINQDPQLVRFARKCIDYAKPKWIPVAERMPPTSRNVLTCNNNGAIQVGAYSACEDVGWMYEHGNLNDLNTRSPWAAITITHWMPLPEKP